MKKEAGFSEIVRQYEINPNRINFQQTTVLMSTELLDEKILEGMKLNKGHKIKTKEYIAKNEENQLFYLIHNETDDKYFVKWLDEKDNIAVGSSCQINKEIFDNLKSSIDILLIFEKNLDVYNSADGKFTINHYKNIGITDVKHSTVESTINDCWEIVCSSILPRKELLDYRESFTSYVGVMDKLIPLEERQREAWKIINGLPDRYVDNVIGTNIQRRNLLD